MLGSEVPANVTASNDPQSDDRESLSDRAPRGPIQELIRRRVPGVAVAYLVVGWAAWQVVDVAAPALGLPDWTLTFVILVTIVGFPVALVLAWAYDLTPDGVVRTPTNSDSGPAEDTDPTRRKAPSDPAEAWERVQAALHEALDLEAGERDRYLERLGATDPDLHDEVQSLLEADAEAAPLDALKAWVAEPPVDPRFEPGAMVAQYRLLSQLGGGGMGVVYKARDTRLDRTVALKFLAPHIGRDRGARERFLVEARSAAALDHPHICTVLEVGETPGGRPFLAMPYYDGESLKDRIRRGALPVADALEIAYQISRGLEAAHRLGIVHRDIKPANIMITSDGIAKIVDFGVAKMTDIALTKTGSTVGTLSYMSPEQARGAEVDHRTDIWSSGVLLYEMISGHRPFSGQGEQGLKSAIIGSSPAPLQAHGSLVPPAVEGILERALAKEPDHRYASVTELARDLRTAAEAGGLVDHVSDPGALVAGGERRICSILVCALRGYDQLLDEVSEEDFERLSDRVRTMVREVVTALGGDLRMADGPRLQAVFGVPTTREDDSARAFQAAMTIRDRIAELGAEIAERVGRGLSVGCGVDSGQAATRSMGEGEIGYRLSGRPLRVAEALALKAEPGQVLVSGESRRLVAGAFTTSEYGQIEVAGDERDVAAHVLLDAATDARTLGSRGGERRLSDFTGREDEMAAVRAAASLTLEGEGQFVAITGEPGMGKSRMLQELVSGPGAWRFSILFGRCDSVARGQSYLPFIEVLRGFLEDGDGELDADAVVQRVLGIDEGLADALPFVLHLLSLEHGRHPLPKLHGDQLRAAVLQAISGVLSVLSTEKPLAILLEDWHWVDEASHAALLHLLEVVPAFRLIVLVTYRPGYRVEFRDIPNTTVVSLGPVGATTSVALFRSALGSKSIDADLAELVVKRIDGNPFFIEEMAASLTEDGTISIVDGRASLSDRDGVRLPDSVHAVIRTRLDRIDPESRGVLLRASVIGQDFASDLLNKVIEEGVDLDRALGTLKKAGLVQQTKVLPRAAFRFKHALTFEVTYESLLAHHRRQLHQRVGELLEAEEPDTWDRLAYHFGQAGDWEKAVSYGYDAAQRAIRLSESGEARMILDRVEKWALRLPEGPDSSRRLLMILFEKERLFDLTGQRGEQRAIIERLRPIVAQEGAADYRIELALREGDLLTAGRSYGEAEPLLLEAIDRSRDYGDPALLRKALRSRGMHLWYEGRGEEALEVLNEAVSLDRELHDIEGEVVDLQNIVRVYRALHRHEEALALAEDAARLAAKAGDMLSVGYTANLLALCHASLGQIDEAISKLEHIREEMLSQGILFQGAFSLTSLAHMYLQAGQVEKSVDAYDDAIAYARRGRDAEGLARSLEASANVLTGLGRQERAIEHLAEAAPLFRQLEQRDSELEATCELARLHEAEGHDQEAMAAWGSARQLARDLGDIAKESEALEGLATSTRTHLGDAAIAIPYYEEALEKAVAVGEQRAVGRLRNTLGVLAWERGSIEEAAGHYEGALEAFRSVGDSEGTALALTSLGATYTKLGADDRALEAILEGVDASQREGLEQLRGYALALLGDARLGREELEEAEAAFKGSLEIRRDLRDERGEGWMLLKLSQIEERRGSLDRVRDLASQAYGIATRVGDQALLEACTAQGRF